MRTESKLAAMSGQSSKTPLHEIVSLLRRVLPRGAERRSERPLRDIDGWSDQSEIAFLEEVFTGRA